MPNKQRGDSEFLAGTEKYVMRLTLGALAEIENGLGLQSLADITQRLKQLASGDLAVIATALLHGGGHDLSMGDVLKLATDVGTLIRAVAEAFDAATPAKSDAAAGGGNASVPLTGAAPSNSASA